MKKLLILLLLFSLTLGMFASCVPNDTSSAGEISEGVSTDISVDESTTVEVTDEAVIAEIKALLEKYNEYVLIVNMCEGAIDADKDAKLDEYSFSIFDWFEFNVEEEIYGPTPSTDAGDDCVKITDARFDDQNDFKDMLYEIYTKENAEMFYASEFAYSYPHGDFGAFYRGFSNFPLFVTINEELYSTQEFKDYAVLTKRYIDLSTVLISESRRGYIITARGASIFKDSNVQAADSDVKILIVNENESFKIEYMEAISDHNKVLQPLGKTDEEKLQAIIDDIDSMLKLINTSVEADVSFDDIPQGMPLYGYEKYYKAETDKLKNMADLYDWAYRIFLGKKANEENINVSHPEYIFHQRIFHGNYDSSGIFGHPAFYNDESGLYSINKKEIIEELHNLKFTPIETGYIGNNDHSDFYFFDKVDMFGDGEYTFKISEVKSRYDLTDEEKALLGIE